MGTKTDLQGGVEQTASPDSTHSPEDTAVDSLLAASLLAFTGGSLDAILWLNHGHVFAGVMSGNVILGGAAVFNRSLGGAAHYAWPVLAYVCGILLITIFQRHVRSRPATSALSMVIVGLILLSLWPRSFPENPFIFLVVLIAGFMVGIARKVDSYSYNATVLTGTLRDGTTRLYEALDPSVRRANLEKSRALWLVMSSFLLGAVCGGLLGKHLGNHALWLPVLSLVLVLSTVLAEVKRASALT